MKLGHCLEHHWIQGLTCAVLLAVICQARLAAQRKIVPAQQLQELMDRKVGTTSIPGAELRVYDGKTDRLLFQYQKGNLDQPIAVASASKWVTSATLMAIVTDGLLNQTSTTGEQLGWSGSEGTVTLTELLSFTSGLRQDVLCLVNHRGSLASCTERVEIKSEGVEPGKVFEYGGAHMVVAGRMAEVATQQSWNTLFETYVRQPLNLSSDAGYGGGTLGDRQILLEPTQNPRLDGGLYLRVDDYAKFLQAIYHQGQVRGKSWIRADLVQFMERSQFTSETKIKYSPGAWFPIKFEYGLGNWVECVDQGCQRQLNSSLGAFGFYPWIDREKEYYAIFAMEQHKGGKASAAFVFEARPLIEALVANR